MKLTLPAVGALCLTSLLSVKTASIVRGEDVSLLYQAAAVQLPTIARSEHAATSVGPASNPSASNDRQGVGLSLLMLDSAVELLEARRVPKFLFGLSQDEFVTNTGRSAQGVRSSDDLGLPERVTGDVLLTSPPHLTLALAPSASVAGSASELPQSSSSLHRQLQSTSSRHDTPPIEPSNNALTSPVESNAARVETSEPYRGRKHATKEEAQAAIKQSERARYLKSKLARLRSSGESVHKPLELKFNAPRIRIPKGTPAEVATRLRAEARREAVLRFKGEPGSQKRIDYNAEELKKSRLKKQAKLGASSSERVAPQSAE